MLQAINPESIALVAEPGRWARDRRAYWTLDHRLALVNREQERVDRGVSSGSSQISSNRVEDEGAYVVGKGKSDFVMLSQALAAGDREACAGKRRKKE